MKYRIALLVATIAIAAVAVLADTLTDLTTGNASYPNATYKVTTGAAGEAMLKVDTVSNNVGRVVCSNLVVIGGITSGSGTGFSTNNMVIGTGTAVTTTVTVVKGIITSIVVTP